MTVPDDPLGRLMTGMADGDNAFFWAFVHEFGPTVRNVVWRIVDATGRTDILRDADEMDSLAVEACEVIFDRAGGWKPGGAKPWNWAHHAIRARVSSSIGHRSVALDGLGIQEDLEGEAGPYGASAVADLTGDDLQVLITRHDSVRLIDDAIRSTGRAEVQDMFWLYRLQQHMADPSPADLVGREFGRKADAVRQAAKRHADRVRSIIECTPEFESLIGHPWFWPTPERGAA